MQRIRGNFSYNKLLIQLLYLLIFIFCYFFILVSQQPEKTVFYYQGQYPYYQEYIRGRTLLQMSRELKVSIGSLATFNQLDHFIDFKKRIVLCVPLWEGVYQWNSPDRVFRPYGISKGFLDSYVGIFIGMDGIKGGRLSSPFGWRKNPYYPYSSGGRRRYRRKGRAQEFHGGIDLAARYGTPVFVNLAGIEVYKSIYYPDFGKTLILDYRGYRMILAHLSRVFVQKGQKLSGEDSLVGLVGNSGKSTGPHLHLELRRKVGKGYRMVNPSNFFREFNIYWPMGKKILKDSDY